VTTIHDLQQGSEAWAQFRAVHFGASEAAAMLGLSKLITRGGLLKQKALGIRREHSDWVQEHVLDHGHRVEAAIRSHIEELIGDLYPVTCSKPGTKLSASCDGLTFDGTTAWECKQWNDELAASVAADFVPDTHMPQCQQILLVTGARRLLFSVSDGTPWKTITTEVMPDPAWFERIERGWAQFEADLASYELPEPAPVVTAAPQEHLPAVSVQVKGSLAVISNLGAFGVALRAFVERIPKAPSTDQEFADTDAACKRLEEVEKRLAAAEDAALGSMTDVEQLRRTVADLRDLARTTRLASEKVVKARKAQIREEEVRRGATAFAAHVTALNERLGRQLMPIMGSDFGSCIKGLKTLDSVRNAIDTELARMKIEANAIADRIAVNLRSIDATEAPQLFSDLQALVLKAPDDLAAIIAQRLQAEQQRQERERERIRQQEAARLEAEQRAKAASEERARQQEAERIAKQRESDAAAESAHVATATKMLVPVNPFECARLSPLPADEPASLNLGAICARLGFTMTAAFVLESLRIAPAKTDKRASLYTEQQFGEICIALQRRIERARLAALEAA
jgi:predicted phage-related endonuclease